MLCRNLFARCTPAIKKSLAAIEAHFLGRISFEWSKHVGVFVADYNASITVYGQRNSYKGEIGTEF